ncbi:MAG: hypothetical protein WCK65_14000 [Rhodospirillaceae bacterium]
MDPATVAEQALARRSRGIMGTIATGFSGVAHPAYALNPEGRAIGPLEPNALLPQRKTLLGE